MEKRKIWELPDSDVCLAYITIGRKFDAILGHRDNNRISNATQIPTHNS